MYEKHPGTGHEMITDPADVFTCCYVKSVVEWSKKIIQMYRNVIFARRKRTEDTWRKSPERKRGASRISSLPDHGHLSRRVTATRDRTHGVRALFPKRSGYFEPPPFSVSFSSFISSSMSLSRSFTDSGSSTEKSISAAACELIRSSRSEREDTVPTSPPAAS